MTQRPADPEPALNESFVRLQQAVARLERAVGGHLDANRQLAGIEREFQRLGEDRSRLAIELDQAVGRAGRLEEANREVSRRLVVAMEQVRSVLDGTAG